MSTRLGSGIAVVSLTRALAFADYLSVGHVPMRQALSKYQSSCADEEDVDVFQFELHARGVRLTGTVGHLIELVVAAVDQIDHARKNRELGRIGRYGA